MLGLAAVLTASWVVYATIKDRHDKVVAAAGARQRFEALRPIMVTRLHQLQPIELGAVWMTHAGVICGLVNGENSFGGMLGMTPFYARGSQVTFGPDVTSAEFGQGWVDCGRDMWIPILPGSTQEGFCATQAGARRCHWTDRKRPLNAD